jgi:hypothetical protein
MLTDPQINEFLHRNSFVKVMLLKRERGEKVEEGGRERDRER